VICHRRPYAPPFFLIPVVIIDHIIMIIVITIGVLSVSATTDRTGAPHSLTVGGRCLQVDVCLYFIAAHRLKLIDIKFMLAISRYVSVIPIIAKADRYRVTDPEME
jgi:hypothetical protein